MFTLRIKKMTTLHLNCLFYSDVTHETTVNYVVLFTSFCDFLEHFTSIKYYQWIIDK